MERAEMRVRTPAKQLFEQMSGIMREPVHARVAALQPAGEEIDGQREAIHLGEQCDEEGAERAERAPVAFRPRLEEAEGEKDEYGRVDNNKRPEAVGRNVVVHGQTPKVFRLQCWCGWAWPLSDERALVS